MGRNLKLLQAYCDHPGLSLNTARTTGFHFAFKRKTFSYSHFANRKLRDESIADIPPQATQGEIPGCPCRPVGRCGRRGSGRRMLKPWVKGTQAGPLRPRQRLEILKTQVIPRPCFHLIPTEASQATPPTKLGQMIQNATKFLHLPPHSAGGVPSTSNRKGGLGVPKLEGQIPSVIARKREALEMASDVVIRASLSYKGEGNTETVAALRELKVLKEIENVQPITAVGRKWTR
ncbi:hypothetical protein chiPu_0020416 [Chiloscyllium punctatum]|uniref:Uncharacterized protein n=1 Tax=Chiloscyllium punctatum TaxID=137246 RepID=A0A401RFF3_CHIPU|nr:hypothetical protein [Chiloscyllium punctatum]